jgi:hypothetical protein
MFWVSSADNISFSLFPLDFSAQFTVPDFATSIMVIVLSEDLESPELLKLLGLRFT